MTETSHKERLSFELDDEMMVLIAKEFSADDIIQRFEQAVADRGSDEVQTIGEEIFRDYGRRLMRRSLELGEEYPDRTYEILREAADRTGCLVFPLVPQRFIEIAFLAIQNTAEIPVLVNNARKLVFRVEGCRLFQQLVARCGLPTAEQMLCRHGCLEACRMAFNGFGIEFDELTFEMNARTAETGYCEFVVRKGSGEFDFKWISELVFPLKKRKK